MGVVRRYMCALTFSSEIRQIQCTRTEFGASNAQGPAGLSALDKHQIQANALDLSYSRAKVNANLLT